MKRLTLTLTAVFSIMILAISCSKDDDNGLDTKEKSEYYFRFKVGGVQINYEFQPETQINLTGGYLYDEKNQLHVIQLSGSATIFEANRNQFVIYLTNTTEFTTNVTYTNIESSGTTPPFYILMGYFDQDGESFSAAPNTTINPLWKNVYVKFDEITDTGIKGTFSGELARYDTSSGKNILKGEVQITDGEFYVPRNNE